MASMLRNLADKLEGKDKQPGTTHSSNTGLHHNAAANAADPRIDSGNTHTVHSHGNPGLVGSQMQSTTTGPHNSDLANKLDPRIDSTQTDGYGTSHTTSHHTGGTGGYGSTTTATHQSTTVGPHSSNLANKLDPRVDSDLDGRNNPTSHIGGHGNTHATTGTGYGHTTTGPGHMGTATTSANAGPHSSNLMNKLDPRVDSDLDGSRNPTSHVGGYGNTHTTDATHGNTTNTGPHSSSLMNTLDPRVDSNIGGRTDQNSGLGGYGSADTHQHGLATQHNTGHPNTSNSPAYNNPQSTNTGPHSSNLLNKLDPRVDSDRDGRNDPTSRTGGYGNTQTGSDRVGRY